MDEGQLKIVYRGYGIADRFPNGIIELNKHLDNYPGLKRALIQHEVKHTNRQNLNKKDFLHDLTTQDQISQWQMMKFIVRHPLSLVQFMPLYYTRSKGWIMDKNLVIIYSILTFIITVGLIIGFST